MNQHTVSMTVNDRAVERPVEPRTSLADFIRHGLELTGTHVGCEQGACGACTVQVDGLPTRACLMLAVQADGAEVATVEGLADAGAMGATQEAFRDALSFQCGFCAPGILMVTDHLVREARALADDELRESLAGNICRCTGYAGILEGARLALSRQLPDDWAGSAGHQ